MILERFYQKIGALFPDAVIRSTQLLMVQGGIETINSRYYLGFSVFFSAACALVAFFLTPFATSISFAPVAGALAALGLVMMFFYLMLVLNADARASRIEAVLPDALQLISSNIRAGMTLENAIWSSARPEFGPLCDEIKRVSADTFGGIPINTTLTSMGGRVRSPMLQRAVKLIVEGIHLGGEMSHLLDEVAYDARSTQQLHKEISTSTLNYVIFIVFAAVLAGPLLFSISTFYSQINQNLLSNKASTTAGSTSNLNAAEQQAGLSSLGGLGGLGGGGGSTAGGIDSNDIYWFSIAAITITTFFAALILGEIGGGKAMQGLKYVPIFIPVALATFLFALGVLQAALSGLLH